MRFRSSILLLAFAVLATDHVAAQDSTDASAWTRSLVGRLSGAQAGFSNWAEGGVNTLAVTVGAEGVAERSAGSWSQKHDFRMTFGMVRQDTLEFRKAEDLIRLRSTLQYTAGEGFLATLQPTIAGTFRSQFAEGKNFEKDPLGLGRTPPVQVSEFLAPATLTQSLGLTWDPSEFFTQRFGVAAKETIVLNEDLRPLYNVNTDKNLRAELGIEAYTDFEKEIAQNVHYKSTLGLFAAFNKADSPDMIWENAVSMKVNSWLGLNVEWTLLYDTDVSDEVQVKEVFSIGLSYVFI